ncbi:MAG: calcium-binding protein, partial [Planctomycetota bacterium]
GTLSVRASDEDASDGDDYIEGNGGDDRIFGNLGQDYIIGGSPNLFSLRLEVMPTSGVTTQQLVREDGGGTIEFNGMDIDEMTDTITLTSHGLVDGERVVYQSSDELVGGLEIGKTYVIDWVDDNTFRLLSPDLRPDGSDLIFGGTGEEITRNDEGDPTDEGHARDADVIAGDNANIYRLVGVNGHVGVTQTEMDDLGLRALFEGFLSFNYDTYSDLLRIIPRAVELVDYTPGGTDNILDAKEAANDQGAGDEIHGESGDDFVYGQVGGDVLFGEGQDDDLIGGYGNDWISGGTGGDGILGDDGRIYTSRNTERANNNDTAFSEPLHGIEKVDEVNKLIDTSGNGQEAIINRDGALKKTVNLTPFALGLGIDPSYDPLFADDILYGGLGDDAVHGGAGDDAMSGAEALSQYYAAPANTGDVLRFGGTARANEFAAYDEFNPLRKILVDENGEFTNDVVNGIQFLLNFDRLEGPLDNHSAGTGFTPVATDGDDVLFGDLGNDWIVGGTGRDHLYGGWGDDLLNSDDNHDSTLVDDGNLTLEDLANDVLDEHPSYNDLAYGGAGRDVMIANTEGDRLTDWAGNFNIYLAPIPSLGAPTVSRTLQPQLPDFLYDLSESDGADPTRASDTGSAEERNGEPDGEIGLVRQNDFAWHDQTGSPPELQLDVIPGGPREVLRAAGFNDGSAAGFLPDSGTFEVQSGRLQVAPAVEGGDAVAVFIINEPLPSYFEILATINAGKPTGGLKSNAFLIFDYQGPEDFKFAGVNISNDKLQMGHRDATGWHVDVQSGAQLKANTDYNILLAINGVTATLLINNTELFSHTFTPRVVGGVSLGLNAGLVGIGADNSIARIDNVVVQVLPPEITFEDTEDFTDGIADLFQVPEPTWSIVANRYEATAALNEALVNTTVLTIAPSSILELEST